MWRQLVGAVREETGVEFDHIILLRNANWRVDGLRGRGGSMDEWVSIKTKGTKYDYWREDKPRAELVVVIVRDGAYDCVFGVYRVHGIEAEGTVASLATEPVRENSTKKNKLARKFRVERISFSGTDARITGWGGKEICGVARSDGTLFWEIKVDLRGSED